MDAAGAEIVSMAAYYNEFDPQAAAWLRELIARGLIADGIVDERSIHDVQPADLAGFTQVHFFAGIGGWSLALRLAGWPDDKPVWTGSCPCQPFSVAGAGKGAADKRHLWPDMFRLIRECRPHRVYGEQVSGAIAHGWLDGISADLEGEGYAVGACVLGAHSVGAPHIRQRLYWMADAMHAGQAERRPSAGRGQATGGGGPCGLADAQCGQRGAERLCGRHEAVRQTGSGAPAQLAGNCATLRLAEPHRGQRDGQPDGEGRNLDRQAAGRDHGDGAQRTGTGQREPDAASQASRLGDADDAGPQGRDGAVLPEHADQRLAGQANPWDSARIIHMRDGKHRRIPTEPALFPLADGLSYKLARRGSIRPALLKGAGNAICPQTAAAFIAASLF